MRPKVKLDPFTTQPAQSVVTQQPRSAIQFSSGQNIQRNIPLLDNNFMLLTSYNLSKIDNGAHKWYDNDTNDLYLQYDQTKSISSKDDSKKFVESLNLKDIELKGPNAYLFANDSNTFEIYEFTFLTMVDLKKEPERIDYKYTLFELICNTIAEGDQSTLHPVYNPQVISITLEKIPDSKVRIVARLGKNTYIINQDINATTFFKSSDSDDVSSNPLLIGLVYNKGGGTGTFTLYVGPQPYAYTINPIYSIKLGTEPFIFNKGGEMDMNVYSIAFYKKALTDSDIDKFKRYNDYYIDGTNALLTQQQSVSSQLDNANKKLSELEKLLSKCQTPPVTASAAPSAAPSASAAPASASLPVGIDDMLPMTPPVPLDLGTFEIPSWSSA
jgi:hypothetical protein